MIDAIIIFMIFSVVINLYFAWRYMSYKIFIHIMLTIEVCKEILFRYTYFLVAPEFRGVLLIGILVHVIISIWLIRGCDAVTVSRN